VSLRCGGGKKYGPERLWGSFGLSLKAEAGALLVVRPALLFVGRGGLAFHIPGGGPPTGGLASQIPGVGPATHE